MDKKSIKLLDEDLYKYRGIKNLDMLRRAVENDSKEGKDLKLLIKSLCNHNDSYFYKRDCIVCKICGHYVYIPDEETS